MGLLRIFFALSVLLGHIQIDYLISPIYAVEGFYIISGFYMALILNEKYITPTSNLTFYKKRFIRLLPTYWLFAIIALGIALCYYFRGESTILSFDFKNFPNNASFLTYLFIIVSNIIIWGQDLALFLGISPETGDLFFSSLSFSEEFPVIRYTLIPVAWSVSSEFTFYLIAPYILRKRTTIVHALFILSVCSNFITNYYGLNNSNWRFRFFPSELMFFLTGYYSYLIYKQLLTYHVVTKLKYFYICLMLSFLTIILKINVPYIIHITILIITSLCLLPLIFHAFRFSPLDRTIGEMSYPLYLIHPLIIGVDYLIGTNSKMFIIIGSFTGAYCCYKYFILRIEYFRNKIK